MTNASKRNGDLDDNKEPREALVMRVRARNTKEY